MSLGTSADDQADHDTDVVDVEAPDDPGGEGGSARPDRIRSITSGIAGLVAVLAILVGGTGLWTLWVAFDSERFERRVDEVLALPEVSDAIAARVVDEVSEAVGVRDAVVELLPGGLEPAADLVLAGARSFVVDRVADGLRRDEVRSAVAGAAGRAHARAVEVVRGGSLVDGLQVVDDELRLDLFPLVGVALTWLQDLGLFGSIDLPELTREAGADANRAALGAALGRDLPPEFGEVVVYRSESLDRAGTLVDTVQRLLVVSARLSWLALAVGLAAAAAAVALAHHRLRAVGLLAAAILVEVALVQFVTDRVANRVPSLVDSTAGQVAIADVISDLQASLVRTLVLVGLGVLVLLAAVVVGIVRRRPDQGEPDPLSA